MAVLDDDYLVGKVIEVNYTTSRVLLLSDLNSSVTVSITPGNVQAIVIGSGKNIGEIKYIKDDLIENIQNKSIAYTSGTGSIFKSGIPVGRININDDKFLINFYSDFDQLKYVFVEIEQNKDLNKINTSIKLPLTVTIETKDIEKIKLNEKT